MSFNNEAGTTTKKVKYFVIIEFECFIYYLSVEVVLKKTQTFFLSKGVPSLAMSAFQGNFKFAK